MFVSIKIIECETLGQHLGPKEALLVMTKVHEGIYGVDHSGLKMRWLKLRAIYYVLLVGVLYKKHRFRVLMRSLGPNKALLVMTKMHKGIYSAH